MPPTILACTDGSSEAEPAIAFATILAGALGARVELLWAWEGLPDIEDVLGQDLAARVTTREVTDRRDRLTALARRHCEPAGVEWTIAAPVGDPVEAIAAASAPDDVHYAVLATHGRSGVKRWRLGSVADKLVRSATTATVLVRARDAAPAPGAIRRILLPLDGSARAEAATEHAAALARATGATIRLIRTVTMIAPGYTIGMDVGFEKANLSAMEAARSYLGAIAGTLSGIKVEWRVEAGAASAVVIDEAQNADLVVMAGHGRGGWRRFALGSVTDAVIRGAATPVLVVPAPRSDAEPDSDETAG